MHEARRIVPLLTILLLLLASPWMLNGIKDLLRAVRRLAWTPQNRTRGEENWGKHLALYLERPARPLRFHERSCSCQLRQTHQELHVRHAKDCHAGLDHSIHHHLSDVMDPRDGAWVLRAEHENDRSCLLLTPFEIYMACSPRVHQLRNDRAWSSQPHCHESDPFPQKHEDDERDKRWLFYRWNSPYRHGRI